MKLFKFLTLQLALCGLMAAMPAAAQTKSHLQTVLERGTLRVGTTGDFNPMSVKDPATNSYKGFDIEAMEQLAKDMGVKVEFVPYVEAGTVPLVLKTNAAKIKTWADLNKKGITVAVLLGTVFEEQAKAVFPLATIKSIEKPANGYQEVLAGRAIATITSNIEAATLMTTYPTLTTLSGAEPRNKRPFAYPIAQNDPTWTTFLNNWVALKTSEGYFKSLEAKWLAAK